MIIYDGTPTPPTELDDPAPATIGNGQKAYSAWVPSYRARSLVAGEDWSSGVGTDYYGMTWEFGDAAFALVAASNFMLNGFAAVQTRTPGAVEMTAITELKIPWPFLCPFQYARAVATGNTPGQTCGDLSIKLRAVVDQRDTMQIAQSTILSHASRGANTYQTGWYDCIHMRAAAVLHYFDESTSKWTGAGIECRHAGAVHFEEISLANLGVAHNTGNLSAFDATTPKLAAAGFYIGAVERSLPATFPFVEARHIITTNATQVFNTDVITFMEP